MKTTTIDPAGKQLTRDNRSGNTKRAKNQSHGQYKAICAYIRDELAEWPGGDFWLLKHNLAVYLSTKYQVKIGQVNHLIEQAARSAGTRRLSHG